MNSSVEKQNSEIPEKENEEFTFQDNSQGFELEFSTNKKTLSKIQKANLSLKTNDAFNISFLKAFSRKNHIYYHVNYKEFSVDICDTHGKNYLPLVTKSEIKKNLDKIKDEKVRSTISDIHFGAIKVLIKARFREGINSPIKMALIDDRITDRQDSILGAAHGNLVYGKFMFTVYPKYTTSILDQRLDRTLAFIHHFERNDLMRKGDKVFSITYLVAYALANSHHSIDYKEKDAIEIDDVFSEIGSVKSPTFTELDPEPNSWAIDIAQGKQPIGFKPKPTVSNNFLRFDKETSPSSSHQKSLEEISDKIDTLVVKLNNIS
ncbi:unnamed protein product [Carnation etched ring virus]|uniref:Movement protein n=1 Tax=Carnation etched ring virus TaxID=10640 RepID=MVP_CERV|nr:Movement protein [Carnation etched ring virus]P05396.1 RecName: Full=Movement protein; Short=Mov; AltName: Full=Cell-to-cell transport protein [Carnation etched ring virus]CAA28356.1 unnamed protein product [Carnation etched ring virus]prf//1301227A ORF 1 [Carnation etched ring virus]